MQPRIRFRLPEGSPLPPEVGQAAQADGAYAIETHEPTKVLYELTSWAIERGISFDTIDVTRPSLEDVYIELTGGEEGRA
jgi:hypothetical protein